MTDGIIQQVINAHMRKHNDPYMDRTYDTFTHEDILQLQQELIEKIKQELSEPNIHTFGCNAVSLQTVLCKLIGDKQQ